MDKVKTFLAVLKKQHFWILCGLASVMGLVFWWMASSSLSGETAANVEKIVAAQGSVKSVLDTTPHPNDKWVQSLDEEIAALRTGVRDVWEKLYQQQKELIYVWPAGLQEDFLTDIAARAETDQIPQKFRERYQNYIMKELSRLAEIVNAEWAADTAEGGELAGSLNRKTPLTRRELLRLKMRGPQAQAELTGEEKVLYKVIWDPTSQTAITDWFNWLSPPTSLRVRYAQEDLWVYEALCKVIARTNVDATGPFDAPVTEIKALQVAFDAAEQFPGGVGENRIFLPVAALGLETEAVSSESTAELAIVPTRPIPNAAVGGSSSSGGETGSGTAELLSPDDELRTWRYVSDTGLPLTAEELLDPPFIEFRLMPFRLDLIIDQRRLDRLLLEFRNPKPGDGSSYLPLEVRQVRINSLAASGVGGGGGGSERGGGGGTTYTGAEASKLAERKLVPVEIRGVAYLFNPPNLEKLGFVVEPVESELAATDEEGSEAAASEEEESTAADGTSPAGEGTVPRRRAATTTTDESARPAGQGTTPRSKPPVAATEAAAIEAEDAAPPEDAATPAEEGAATPAVAPAAATGEEAAPVEAGAGPAPE